MKMRNVCLILTFAICALLPSCVNVNSFNKIRQYEPGGSYASCGGSIRSELYFGLQKPDGTSVNDAEWQDFLDKSISSRFPAGFAA